MGGPNCRTALAIGGGGGGGVDGGRSGLLMARLQSELWKNGLRSEISKNAGSRRSERLVLGCTSSLY
jgi:hypothetical protein